MHLFSSSVLPLENYVGNSLQNYEVSKHKSCAIMIMKMSATLDRAKANIGNAEGLNL